MLHISSLPAWQIACLLAYSCVVLLAVFRLFYCSRESKRIRFLTPDHPRAHWNTVPLVSIMIPAKDEAAVIEQCVRSLMAQDYQRFEILVVDDRSTDDTPQIVQRLARVDGRIRLVRVHELPEGWAGKPHALDLCRRHARGEWFLFVDADTLQNPSCLSVAMRECLNERLDMLSLMPGLELRSFWEKAVQPLASTCLMLLFPLSRVNNDAARDMGFANGQFILIKRSAYESSGGFAAVRNQIQDDIQFGRNIRQAGLKLRVAVGAAISKVRMYTSLAGILSGWSRIFYGAVEGRPGKLWLLFAALCLFSLLPYSMLAASGIALCCGWNVSFTTAMILLASIHELSQWALYAKLYAMSGTSLRSIPLRIIGVFVMLRVLRRSIHMCRTQEVTWKGTTYRHSVRRAA